MGVRWRPGALVQPQTTLRELGCSFAALQRVDSLAGRKRRRSRAWTRAPSCRGRLGSPTFHPRFPMAPSGPGQIVSTHGRDVRSDLSRGVQIL